jgi:DHA1 family inner membrane transport protein
MAIDRTTTASSVVITGLVIAVISIPVAWATGFLKPPVVEGAPAPDVAASPTREAA